MDGSPLSETALCVHQARRCAILLPGLRICQVTGAAVEAAWVPPLLPAAAARASCRRPAMVALKRGCRPSHRPARQSHVSRLRRSVRHCDAPCPAKSAYRRVLFGAGGSCISPVRSAGMPDDPGVSIRCQIACITISLFSRNPGSPAMELAEGSTRWSRQGTFCCTEMTAHEQVSEPALNYSRLYSLLDLALESQGNWDRCFARALVGFSTLQKEPLPVPLRVCISGNSAGAGNGGRCWD